MIDERWTTARTLTTIETEKTPNRGGLPRINCDIAWFPGDAPENTFVYVDLRSE
jgi:hypothetical protein